MATTFDRNVFTQIGLDSGALTSLGAIVHSFSEPGEYRGTVRTDDLPEAVFYVSVDKSCAVAQVNIDLAKLGDPEAAEECAAGSGGPRFVVHPKGYAVFHVSSGAGGYSVNVRRAEENPELQAYDTRRALERGDIFSTVLFRPGTYLLRNTLTRAEARVTVAYPTVGDAAYRPPPAAAADCGERIEPSQIELSPMQGLNLTVTAPARINIELLEADDGPRSRGTTQQS
jgi:hypothetical protein